MPVVGGAALLAGQGACLVPMGGTTTDAQAAVDTAGSADAVATEDGTQPPSTDITADITVSETGKMEVSQPEPTCPPKHSGIVGEPCTSSAENPWQGGPAVCDAAGNAVLVCFDGFWESVGQDEWDTFCQCEVNACGPDSYSSCGVPGFVGVSKAQGSRC